jgi:hypothetical protein
MDGYDGFTTREVISYHKRHGCCQPKALMLLLLKFKTAMIDNLLNIMMTLNA